MEKAQAQEGTLDSAAEMICLDLLLPEIVFTGDVEKGWDIGSGSGLSTFTMKPQA